MKRVRIKAQVFNKSHLIEQLAKKQGIKINLATKAFEAIFESIETSLLKGQNVEIRGLGSFCVKSYKGYKGSDPRDGKPIYVKPKKRPIFKPGKIKDLLNPS